MLDRYLKEFKQRDESGVLKCKMKNNRKDALLKLEEVRVGIESLAKKLLEL